MVLALAAYVHASVGNPDPGFEPGVATAFLVVDLFSVWLLGPV